jgi:hypothetical protein
VGGEAVRHPGAPVTRFDAVIRGVRVARFFRQEGLLSLEPWQLRVTLAPDPGAVLRSTASSVLLWASAIVSVVAFRCRGVGGPVDDGGGLEERVNTVGKP